MRRAYSLAPQRFPLAGPLVAACVGGIRRSVDQAVFELRTRFEELRGPRGFEVVAEGLWCAGALEGLRRPCVAVVGTRAATPYGRRLAHNFAEALGAAGCCIVSGLALGVDSCAHQGALAAGAPTIGVLGGGHECFFPKRNLALAERIIAAGGAVLSPFPPEHPSHPPQFLQRNGIVVALSDAVVVIEAPARSGALNTASWAAGRIPVLVVPGDVDRAHVQGCLALIRDGATLVRSPADVLEAMRVPQPELFPPSSASEDATDPLAQRLLHQLSQGECDLDALIGAGGASARETLAVLALLELDGRIEHAGTARYARR